MKGVSDMDRDTLIFLNDVADELRVEADKLKSEDGNNPHFMATSSALLIVHNTIKKQIMEAKS